MKTKSFIFKSALCLASVIALQPTLYASVNWDSPAAVPAGQRVEYAKAAITTDASGNVFTAGYRDFGAGNVEALVTYRTNAGVGLPDSLWRPTADQYHYTGVIYDATAKSLYLSGTRIVGGTSTWFVRSVAVSPGVAIGAQNWIIYLNPATLGVGVTHSFGCTLAFDGVSVFASGCLTNGMVVVKLKPSTGALDGTWPAVAPGKAGVRYVMGANWTCPPLAMPGSVTGGIFQSVRQSFVRTTGSSVFLGSTLNRATGLLEDMAVLRVEKAAGGVMAGFPAFRDNGGQRDCMFGLAAIADYAYASGASVNGASVPTAMTLALMANGTDRGGSPVLGAPGSWSNDIEAFDNAGSYTMAFGGNNAATGFVTRYVSTPTGGLGAPSTYLYGAAITDEVCDITFGVGATTGVLYATGQSWDAASLTNCQQVMRVDGAGFVSFDRLTAGYAEDNGCAVIYTTVGSVLTGGNAFNGGVFTLQRSSVAP